MQIRRAHERDRHRCAVLAAALQQRPERHIGFLGSDAETIAAEMVADDEDWTAVTAIAEHDGEIVGWLMGSVDADMGRVWWFGPFVDVGDDQWEEAADALYRRAHNELRNEVGEEEFAPDSRFEQLTGWAITHGFHVDPGSVVVVLRGDPGPAAPDIRPLSSSDAPAVARLHDELFPGTHTPGAALVASCGDEHVRLVVERDGRLAGYVAVDRQPGGDGYVDFLGVDPAFRRHGIGRELVKAGVAALREIGCSDIGLTVREANAGARALYAGLGFEEERILRPLRKGFSLP